MSDQDFMQINSISEMLGLQEHLETDKIVLKQYFIHPKARTMRVNSFKAMMRDGELQIYIDNGKDKDGRKNYAGIRLSKVQMKQLMDMLQRNIK